MKKYFLLALFAFTINVVSAQKLSETNKRFYFFKVWNLIKYYHPDLASGKTNADTLFLNSLKAIDKAKTKKQYNAYINTLLSGLSKQGTKKAITDNEKSTMYQNLDQQWFRSDPAFNTKNKKELAFIFDHRYTGAKHHYIPDLRYTTLIPNEAIYTFPDTVNLPYPMRMLALAKLQGTADYLFPHKYLTDKNLDTVIQQNISLFAACNSRLEYEKLLLKVSSSFNDTHNFRFINQIKNKRQLTHSNFFPPFNYKVFENGIMVTEIIIPENCEKGNIKIGDFITAINGQPVTQVIDTLSTVLSASNRTVLVARLSNYTDNLIWPSTSTAISLTTRRGTVTATNTITFVAAGDYDNAKRIMTFLNRDPEPTDNKRSIQNNNIAYFKVNETIQFLNDIPDEKLDKRMDSILDIAAHQKGIIFDMRGYPDWGGFIQYYVLRKFGKTPLHFADYYEINKNLIGSYVRNDETDTYYRKELVTDNNPAYTGKVIIIVNSQTLSMSEFLTMLLQRLFPQSITLGEQSAGADGDEKIINLPGNYEFNFTGNAIFYPDGTYAQRKGVKIDKPLSVTPQDLQSKRDPLLDNAIQLIKM